MRTPEQYAKALEYFQHAVELDPDYARAHAAIALVYWKRRWEGWYPTLGRGIDGSKAAAAEFLRRAMTEPSPLAYQVAAQMHLWEGRYEDAVVQAHTMKLATPTSKDSRALAWISSTCQRSSWSGLWNSARTSGRRR